MVRIVGVQIPEDKKLPIALTYITGVGETRAYQVLRNVNISFNKKVQDLSDKEITKLQKEIEKFPTEGVLRKRVSENIERLKRTGTYRGARHRAGLPVRGQRTRTNARTKRGKRKTVGAFKKDMLQKQQGKKKTKTAESGGK
jgi:small subunit ribosomal protein S13